MTLVDNVEAGKLTISELIDSLAKDKNYSASKWDQRYREFTTLLQQTSTFAEPETDDLVKRLWYERDNGNDPDTLLRDFIHKNITKPALTNDAIPEQDPVIKLAGVVPDYAARLDFSKQLSPAALHKMKIRQEQMLLQKNNSISEGL